MSNTQPYTSPYPSVGSDTWQAYNDPSLTTNDSSGSYDGLVDGTRFLSVEPHNPYQYDAIETMSYTAMAYASSSSEMLPLQMANGFYEGF